MKKRYKVRKEQLERVVESFVMESAPEAKKHVKGSLGDKMTDKTVTAPEKDWGVTDGVSNAPEARKHIKPMGGNTQTSGKGMKNTPTSKTMKKSQSPEAKKHVNGSVSEGLEPLDEVSPDEAVHADAINFLAQNQNAEAVKSLYAAYKSGDGKAGKKLIPFLLRYAQNTLKKDKDGASDFIKDLSRVLDGEMGRAVKSAGGVSGGLGI